MTTTGVEVEREMLALFAKYPNGFPDNLFHEICDLGD